MLQKQVVHRGYSATERQLGHIYGSWRIVARRKIPRFLRWLYDGKVWEFIGKRVRPNRLSRTRRLPFYIMQ